MSPLITLAVAFWFAVCGIYPLADPGHWPPSPLVLIDWMTHATGMWWYFRGLWALTI